MKVTRFGHAALLIETEQSRILIDPGAFCVPEVFDLTDLDAIVVTHQHADHFDVNRAPALVEANRGATLICDPQTAGLVTFGQWNVNADGKEFQIGDLTLRGVGSQHAVILPNIPRINNVGVVVTDANGRTLFHPGDTYEYAPQGIDLLALPLSAPWAKSAETVDFVQRVAPKALIPIHDCTASAAGKNLYWGQVVGHGGVADARLLDQTESTTI